MYENYIHNAVWISLLLGSPAFWIKWSCFYFCFLFWAVRGKYLVLPPSTLQLARGWGWLLWLPLTAGEACKEVQWRPFLRELSGSYRSEVKARQDVKPDVQQPPYTDYRQPPVDYRHPPVVDYRQTSTLDYRHPPLMDYRPDGRQFPISDYRQPQVRIQFIIRDNRQSQVRMQFNNPDVRRMDGLRWTDDLLRRTTGTRKWEHSLMIQDHRPS